ncbi:MAG: cytochrome c-type biogenesis protein CcmH [Bradymonadia bacterium]
MRETAGLKPQMLPRWITMLCMVAMCATAAVSWMPAAQAQDPAPAAGSLDETEANRLASKLADQLKSPFCPGKTLLTCTSGKAFEVRREIKIWLSEGKSKEEVLQLLQERYGDDIRTPPQPWLTGLVPILPFVLGGGVLGIAVLLWRKRGALASDEEDLPELSDDPETQARLARLRKQIGDDDA